MKNTLDKLIEKIRLYIMDDTVRKENFADIEICCAEDNEEADERVSEILSTYTLDDCKRFIETEGI